MSSSSSWAVMRRAMMNHHTRLSSTSTSSLQQLKRWPTMQRMWMSGKPESLEEMARRLSEEAESEFRAKGSKSTIKFKRAPRATPPPPSSSNPTDASSSSSSSSSTEQSSSSSSSSSSTPVDTAASSTSSSTHESSSTSTSTPPPPPPSPPKPRKSFLATLQEEWKNLRDHLEAHGMKTEERRVRTLDELSRAPLISIQNKRVQREGEAAAKASAAKKGEGEAAEGEEEEEPITASGEFLPPAVIRENETVWDRRLERLSSKFRSSAPLLAFRRQKRTLIAQQNPLFDKVRETAAIINTVREDVRETLETTQHPLVWKMRDVKDVTVGESDMAHVFRALRKADPDFNVLHFVDELREYMIPAVISAYLQGDMNLLRNVLEGQALNAVWATVRERDTLKVRWDPRILDIGNIEIDSGHVAENTPFLRLHFTCQHVHCVRRTQPETDAERRIREQRWAKEDAEDKAAGRPLRARPSTPEELEIVQGSMADLQQVFYVWEVRRDFDNPDFDWKITQMVWQRVMALV